MVRAAYLKIKNSAELPSPTGVALRVLKIAQDENSSVDEIAAAVSADGAISARLLKIVNSPLAGSPRQIASVSRAVALLGARAVTSLALGFSLLADHRAGPCSVFDYGGYWSDSLARAVAARHLASRIGGFSPDEVFTCGLLGQIGRLALASAFPEAYANALSTLQAENDRELEEIERALFEIDHSALAAEMMADWQLPELFRQAVRGQSDPDAADFEPGSRGQILAKILHLAGLMAAVLTHPMVYRNALTQLVLEANRLGVAPDAYHHVFDSVSAEWREAGAIFSVSTRQVPPLGEIYARAQECLTRIDAPGSGEFQLHSEREGMNVGR